MFGHITVLILWATGVGVTAFALWKGDFPEKAGAGLNMICAVAAELAHMVWGPESASVALLAIDLALAMGFLGLAVRYASLWLGMAMIMQAVQFSLHAFYLVTERPHDLLYYRVNNIDTIAITLSLVVGTVISWRRRSAAEAADQAQAARLGS